MEQVNRLLNPNTSEELKNTCSYLKESLHLRDTVFKNSQPIDHVDVCTFIMFMGEH
jgi:hypothetical protein